MTIQTETWITILELISQSLRPSAACRACNVAESTFWLRLKRAREQPQDYLIAWPDPDGTPVSFADAYITARRMSIMRFEAAFREEAELGVLKVVTNNEGVVWAKDPFALAMFGGETDLAKQRAEDLGWHDYPYLHDDSGSRVALTLREPIPAAAKIHASRASIPGWNVTERREVDQRVNGKVLITGATRQGAAARPAYAKPELSPLQRDLLQRVAALDAPGRNTRPNARVDVGAGRGDGNDPPEKIGA
jgi:hypothetical protein